MLWSRNAIGTSSYRIGKQNRKKKSQESWTQIDRMKKPTRFVIKLIKIYDSQNVLFNIPSKP